GRCNLGAGSKANGTPGCGQHSILCRRENVYWLISRMLLALANLFLEELLKLLQLFLVNVGNSPVVQVRVYPVQQLIALSRHCLGRSNCISPDRPDKEIKKMLAPLINQSRHRPVVEIIETAADQRKAFL